MAESREEARETVTAEAEADEVVVAGVAAAPGIAIGPAFVYARDTHPVEQRDLTEGEIDAEVKRFQKAVDRSEQDLSKIAALAADKLGPENAAIFEAQAMMLRDDELYGAVIADIKNQRVNADFALHRIMTRHRRLMSASDSEYLRERANDLLELQDRIIRHLRRGTIISAVKPESIVIAETLTSADIVLFARRRILGCAMEFGGPTSHVSIMARALDVPTTVSTNGIVDLVNDGDMVIIDGIKGEVIIRPDEATLARHRHRQERYRRLRQEQKQLVDLPSETIDGTRVDLLANVEFREELTLLKEYGAEGIGLFRTEILMLMQRRMSISEEEQYRTYRHIIQAVAPQPTVVRVLDLGGDKMLPLGHREQNPFLGWRGIRILLDKPDLLIPQLRAILRAARFGPTQLLLPMISSLQEVAQFREILEDVKRRLRDEQVEHADDIPIGIMVEVPAVALTAEAYAREVDFLSIGTNDLTQYTLAVDRGNDLVATRYQELHPAVLHLIKKTIDAGAEAGIPVSMCGEMAGDANFAPLLFGLGLRQFSASPIYLPAVKRILRSIKKDEAEALARHALTCRTAEEVNVLLTGWLDSHGCARLSYLPNGGNGSSG